MLAVAVARYLDGLDLVTYRTETAAGDCFIGHMPSGPDTAVMVMPTGGLVQPTRQPTDRPTVQVRVRGAKQDPIGPHTRALAIYDVLACLDGVLLDPAGPDEVWVIGCTPAQSAPVPMGQDDNGRHEWSLNFQFHTHAPTAHRPALA